VALAVVQGCVTQLIDIGRPLTASVAAPAQTDTSSVDLTTALSRLADARDRPDDVDQAPVYAQLLAEIQSPV
jgi:hypothetical protein